MHQVRSMRGHVVDMARLAAENAHKPALGNASMNARGDLITSSGSVLKSREDIARDYHASNPKAIKQVALRDLKHEVYVTPAEALANAQSEPRQPKSKRKIAD